MNINPWFVTGFIEGEGAFTYSTQSGVPHPVFSIRQRADYSDMVQSVKDFFGVGSIYICSSRGPTKQSAYLRVCNAEDLPKVVRHFGSYPIQSVKKRKAFELWKSLVALWTENQGNRSKMAIAKPKMRRLAAELSLANVRPRPGIRVKPRGTI